MKQHAQVKRHDSDSIPPHALELFQPRPNVLYSLDAAAHIAGVPRRALLVYCRAGLVRSVLQPPYGVLAFSEEAIHAARRIEQVRTTHGPGLVLLKAMFDLVEEVEQLRAEVRFLRQH
jgi:DNA-binding transcriptional MerR regulator